MGKRYVMINELKPEHVQDYIEIHMVSFHRVTI